MILVNSDVLIAHLRGVDAAGDWMRAARIGYGRLAVRVVSYAEITGGAHRAERDAVASLFSVLELFDVDRVVAHRAAELQRAHRRSNRVFGIADYLIVATAQVHGMDLATLNVKHFPRFADLRAPFTLSG